MENSTSNQISQNQQLCGCGCEKALKRDDKEEGKKIDGKLVSIDCYYEAIGIGIEARPIERPRVRR